MSNFDFDLSELLKETALKKVEETLEEDTYDVECPYCDKEFEAHQGKNICPHCKKL